jgi:hypothetical protein
VPAFLVADLPAEPSAAAAALGLPFTAFGPARGGAWQADLDLPRGTSWRLFPDRRAALWVAREAAAAVPPISPVWTGMKIELLDGLLRLAEVERVWLSEAALLDAETGWTSMMGATAAIRALADGSDVLALSGTWSDERGRAVYAELHRDGRIRAETYAQAERWLLTAAGIDVDARS